MAGLVGGAVFDVGPLQGRGPDDFANGLVVIPGLIGSGVVKDDVGGTVDLLLIQQGGQGFGLQGDLTHAGFGLGGLVDAAHLGDPHMKALLGEVDISCQRRAISSEVSSPGQHA